MARRPLARYVNGVRLKQIVAAPMEFRMTISRADALRLYPDHDLVGCNDTHPVNILSCARCSILSPEKPPIIVKLHIEHERR